jgi:hypothetical protein
MSNAVDETDDDMLWDGSKKDGNVSNVLYDGHSKSSRKSSADGE